MFSQLFCKHKWEERKSIGIYEDSNSKRPYRIKLIYICPKCGKIKRITIKA